MSLSRKWIELEITRSGDYASLREMDGGCFLSDTDSEEGDMDSRERGAVRKVERESGKMQ